MYDTINFEIFMLRLTLFLLHLIKWGENILPTNGFEKAIILMYMTNLLLMQEFNPYSESLLIETTKKKTCNIIHFHLA